MNPEELAICSKRPSAPEPSYKLVPDNMQAEAAKSAYEPLKRARIET